jgi:transcription antitermination factor NusG
MDKNWFVFYTKSRHEKNVNELLLKRGFESFLPMQSVMRQWSDRKKKVVVPLFNSYIFVCVEEHRIPEVLQISGISWVIRHNGKPAILHAYELETIQRFVTTGLLIESSSEIESFQLGDQVKVLDGPLKGANGHLTAFHNKHRFSIILSSIGQIISIEIDRNIVSKLTDKELITLAHQV